MNARDVKKELKALSSGEKAKASARFFKTNLGEYGQGDHFIGVTVPEQRRIARQFSELPRDEVITLLESPIHEHRLTALFILVSQYQFAVKRKDDARQKTIVDLYHGQRNRVNNWDLVDSSAPHLLGRWLLERNRALLYRYAKSRSLWDRRIAIIATSAFIKVREYTDTLELAELLLQDREDLIHKAVGWMLREVGKQDQAVLKTFLDRYASIMPRTMLRSAIEKLPREDRQRYLSRKRAG